MCCWPGLKEMALGSDAIGEWPPEMVKDIDERSALRGHTSLEQNDAESGPGWS